MGWPTENAHVDDCLGGSLHAGCHLVCGPHPGALRQFALAVAAHGLSRHCPVVYCARQPADVGATDPHLVALAGRARAAATPFEVLAYGPSLEPVVEAAQRAARATGASPLVIVDECLTLIEAEAEDRLLACEAVEAALTMLSTGLGCTVLGLAALSGDDTVRLCERQSLLTRRDAPARNWLPWLYDLLPHTIIAIQPIGHTQGEATCATIEIVAKERRGERLQPLLVRLDQEFTTWLDDS